MSSDLNSIYSQRNLNLLNSSDNSIYEFDRFRLDAAHRMLYANDSPVQLAPKVIETLIALVERRGEILSKDELMRRIWADSFVEESNLTQNIYLLRKTLGKTADGRDLIESFRRRGYRFNGEIKRAESHPAARRQVKAERRFVNRGKVSYTATAFAISLLAIFAAPRLFDSANKRFQNLTAANSNLKFTRLTPDLNIRAANLSPDGKSLVYTLREKGKSSVWLKDLATGAETQILPPIDEEYYGDTISRDNFIYFSTRRPNAPNYTIVRVPLAGGGEEQTIASDLTSPFALSPNEKQIAFINGKNQLIVAQADGSGGSPRVLAARNPKTGWFESWGSQLSWSPDGESIVVCGGVFSENRRKKYQLLEISLTDGSEKIIPTPDWNYLDDAVWLSDKSGLIVVARETETAPFQIWRVAYPSGETRRLTNDTNEYTDPTLSSDSRRLVAVQSFENKNLWRASLADLSRPKQITFGSAARDGFYGLAFAPDSKIIYTSPRGGNLDLWQTTADGGEQKQLTKNVGDWNAKPDLSADNRFIVFVSTRSGTKQIWRADADGGNPTRLTDEMWADEPSVAPDGKRVYFSTTDGERVFIAEVPVNGGGDYAARPRRISRQPFDVFSPVVSPDGKLIFCQIYDETSNEPWKNGVLSAATGEMIKIFDFHIGSAARWTQDSKSIVFATPLNPNLRQFSIADNQTPQKFTDYDSGAIRTFAFSPDFKQIVFSRGNPTSEAILLENF